MSNIISHSSTQKWMECPTKWKYHYVDKLRAKTTGAGLLFGTAIDQAFTTRFKDPTKKPKDTFNYFWRFQDINKTKTYLPTCTEIAYSKTDFDEELLLPEDINTHQTKYNLTNVLEDHYMLTAKRNEFGYDNLEKEEQERYNHLIWLSLFRKGHLMIDALETKIIPNITKVHAVQKYVKLENSEGDSVIGYVDIVFEYKGYTLPIIADWKTSTRDYDADEVLRSPQLSLYTHILSDEFKTRLAGFFVFNKQVVKNRTKICQKCGFDGSGTRFKSCNNEVGVNAKGKPTRCEGEWTETINPEVRVQVLINEIPPRTEEIVLENFDHINVAMKNKVYNRNLNSCITGYGKCTYYNKCYYDNNDGLKDMTNEKKETT